MGVYCKQSGPLKSDKPITCYKVLKMNVNGTYESAMVGFDYTEYINESKSYHASTDGHLPVPIKTKLSDYDGELHYYDDGGMVYSYANLEDARIIYEKVMQMITLTAWNHTYRIVECEIPEGTEYNEGNSTKATMKGIMDNKSDAYVSEAIRPIDDITDEYYRHETKTFRIASGREMMRVECVRIK